MYRNDPLGNGLHNLKKSVFEKITSSNGKGYSYFAEDEIEAMQNFLRGNPNLWV